MPSILKRNFLFVFLTSLFIFVFSIFSFAQDLDNVTISGQVTDSNNAPIVGANVVAKSATKGGSVPAGMATAIGFVPKSLSTENVGATRGEAFVMAMPIISLPKAIMA